MSDLISRQWLMECVNEGWIQFDTEKDENRFMHLVRDIAPSAQPQRMKGRWYHGDAYPHHLYCSVCYRTALPNDEYVERWNLHMNYCPNCGADMRGEQDG